MDESAFTDGVRRCLPRAEAAHNAAQPDVCVMNAHLVVEYGAKILYIRRGTVPKYESLKQVLDTLLVSGALDPGDHAEMDWLRQLRNKVYHEAYVPTIEDSERALKVVQNCARLVLPPDPA